jgi:hypothetical protein
VKIFAKILLVVLLSSCSDVVTTSYATYDEAVKDEIFLQGWLPDVLPTTTKNIVMRNDLDLNTSKGSFTIPSEDISAFLTTLTKKAEDTYIYESDRRGKFWVFKVESSGHVEYVLNQ